MNLPRKVSEHKKKMFIKVKTPCIYLTNIYYNVMATMFYEISVNTYFTRYDHTT